MLPRRPITTLSAIAVLAAPLTACGPLLPGATVGHVVVQWDEATHDLSGFDKRAPVRIIATEEDWLDWLEELPPAMRDANGAAVEQVDLDDSVLLVAAWPRCTEVASVEDGGGGAVRFALRDPEPETMCAWSPTQVQVWDLPLSQLGVERGEVHLVP